MTAERRQIIAYRLERAHEALEEAKMLLNTGYANTCVNRLYYACFYVVSALLLIKGFSSSKHKGVRAFFHQYVVKTGLIDVESGQVYDKLFLNRQKGDYTDLVRFDEHDVTGWLDEAQQFVQTIEQVVQKELERIAHG
jgi:uncharacterized protein (UPF0332 family)